MQGQEKIFECSKIGSVAFRRVVARLPAVAQPKSKIQIGSPKCEMEPRRIEKETSAGRSRAQKIQRESQVIDTGSRADTDDLANGDTGWKKFHRETADGELGCENIDRKSVV